MLVRTPQEKGWCTFLDFWIIRLNSKQLQDFPWDNSWFFLFFFLLTSAGIWQSWRPISMLPSVVIYVPFSQKTLLGSNTNHCGHLSSNYSLEGSHSLHQIQSTPWTSSSSSSCSSLVFDRNDSCLHISIYLPYILRITQESLNCVVVLLNSRGCIVLALLGLSCAASIGMLTGRCWVTAVSSSHPSLDWTSATPLISFALFLQF